MSEEERWEKIISFRGFVFNDKYEVSNFGRVRNVKNRNILKTYPQGDLGVRTKLVDENGFRKSFYIHQLVAYFFLGAEQNCKNIKHKDGDVFNNHYQNLECETKAGNSVKELILQTVERHPITLGKLSTKLHIQRTRLETLLDEIKCIYEDDDGKLKIKEIV